MIRLLSFFVFSFFSFSVFSATYTYDYSVAGFMSPSEICSTSFHRPPFQSYCSSLGMNVTVTTLVGSPSGTQCLSTLQINPACPSLSQTYTYGNISSITCADSYIPIHFAGKNASCLACPVGQVANPYTKQCQAPCPVEPMPPSSIPGSYLSLGPVNICSSGCVDAYYENYGDDSNGFTFTDITHHKTGAMCAVGDNNEPPTPDAPSCKSPKIVRADGTCGEPDPVCPAWQEVKDLSLIHISEPTRPY